MDINWIVSIIFMIFWLVIIFHGQKLQISSMIRRLEVQLFKLKVKRERFKREGYKLFLSDNTASNSLIIQQLNEAIEHYTILPTNLDPNEIVPKIKHIVLMRDRYFEKVVMKLFPNKPKEERRNLESVIQIIAEVEMLYKIARHYYFIAKKTKEAIWALQSGMIIQEVQRFFESFKNAMISITNGIPIGDGIGAMVAEKLGRGNKWNLIDLDTVMVETQIENHKTFIIKAQGVGSTTGQVNEALAKIINDIDVVIMVDAALKAEGDISGEVITGEGAAIGGIGVEKFEIEEMVSKRRIPIYAFLIKESLGEAIGPMTKEINASCIVAISKIKELIKSFQKDKIIAIIGVGNTLGIGQ